MPATENAHFIPAYAHGLAVADGEGRNSVFLAKMGHRVQATDIAEEAIAKAHSLRRHLPGQGGTLA